MAKQVRIKKVKTSTKRTPDADSIDRRSPSGQTEHKN
jgi:hypothetical protein